MIYWMWMGYKSLALDTVWSSIQCIRGARSTAGHAARRVMLPTDLVTVEAGFDT